MYADSIYSSLISKPRITVDAICIILLYYEAVLTLSVMLVTVTFIVYKNILLYLLLEFMRHFKMLSMFTQKCVKRQYLK